MPHELKLPRRLKAQGWKVKIREKERLEPPHVTVMCKTREWRVSLRDGEFLVPPGGSWNDIPKAVREMVEANWQALQAAWDAKYPTNPIASEEDGDDEDT
ncbi:MAG: hypothetical protein U0746_10500 [Gemmataceae bacterium]